VSQLRQALGLVVVGAILAGGCGPKVRLSAGTRIAPELRGVSSAEATTALTRHDQGEHVSLVATLIDFAYVRAVYREGSRSLEQEREAYNRYIRRQTTFYVHLLLHTRENCQPRATGQEEEPSDPLQLRDWYFVVRSSTGQDLDPVAIEASPTRLAPHGGCLVQGYVHFPRNISRRAEWVTLETGFGEDQNLRSDVEWRLGSWTPPPPTRRARPRER
jgi:hypothetical protein